MLTPLVAFVLALAGRPSPAQDRAARCEALLPAMSKAASAAGVDVGLVVALVAHESGFRMVNNRHSGARGYMQVLPSVGRGLGCGNLSDGDENLRCGTLLLARFLTRYDGRILMGLAGYGGGNVVAGKAVKDKTIPSNFAFVEQILGMRTRFLRNGCVL